MKNSNLNILFLSVVLSTSVIARPGTPSPSPAPAARSVPMQSVRTSPMVQPPRPTVAPQQSKMAGMGYQRQFNTTPTQPKQPAVTQQYTQQQRVVRQYPGQTPSISPTTAGVGGAVVGGLVGYAIGSSNNTPTQQPTQAQTIPAPQTQTQPTYTQPSYQTPEYQVTQPAPAPGYYPPQKYSSSSNGWLWFIGIVLVLVAAYLFFRNHAKGKKVYEQYVDPLSKSANWNKTTDWTSREINNSKHDKVVSNKETELPSTLQQIVKPNSENVFNGKSVDTPKTPTYHEVVGSPDNHSMINKTPVKLTFDVNSDRTIVLDHFKQTIECNFKDIYDSLQYNYRIDQCFSAKNVSISFAKELNQARMTDTDIVHQPELVTHRVFEDASYNEVEGSYNWITTMVVEHKPNPTVDEVIVELWNYKFNNNTTQWELIDIQI